MSHYAKNDYALNKKSAGIVYDFADGAKEITLEDFLDANPGATPDDFAALKAWSDEDYLESDRHGYNTTRMDVSLDWADQAGKCKSDSPEESLVAAIDAHEVSAQKEQRAALAKQALDKLSDIQRRRYLLYRVDGLTLRQIADMEGVAFQVIDRSISAAEKKIKKILAGSKKTG